MVSAPQALTAHIVKEAHDTMKLPILHHAIPMLALSLASLGGCTRDAESGPVAHIEAGASASTGWPAYMEEFNESIRSMSGEHESGVHINRGWGVFNTIKATPSAEPAASACAAPTGASGAPEQAHRSVPAATDSRMS
ncbi:putative lipoprotein [Burkholderia thailandensis USAMRU Malaysia |nr:putative lipoprotein [Burkholderia thailandensis 2002721723]AHI80979.1 putative lipoprotein [Burkholderia thailandensis E444]AIC89484.1 putative lipoprotein [Burkholderia thailandensis USAMRU Malaysia \